MRPVSSHDMNSLDVRMIVHAYVHSVQCSLFFNCSNWCQCKETPDWLGFIVGVLFAGKFLLKKKRIESLVGCKCKDVNENESKRLKREFIVPE